MTFGSWKASHFSLMVYSIYIGNLLFLLRRMLASIRQLLVLASCFITYHTISKHVALKSEAHLSKDKRSIILLGQLSFPDGLHWGWSTTENPWRHHTHHTRFGHEHRIELSVASVHDLHCTIFYKSLVCWSGRQDKTCSTPGESNKGANGSVSNVS